jgi:hypothetical protein
MIKKCNFTSYLKFPGVGNEALSVVMPAGFIFSAMYFHTDFLQLSVYKSVKIMNTFYNAVFRKCYTVSRQRANDFISVWRDKP